MNAHSISDKILCARNSNNNNLHVLNRIHETETLRRQIGRDWATWMLRKTTYPVMHIISNFNKTIQLQTSERVTDLRIHNHYCHTKYIIVTPDIVSTAAQRKLVPKLTRILLLELIRKKLLSSLTKILLWKAAQRKLLPKLTKHCCQSRPENLLPNFNKSEYRVKN